MLSLDAAIVVLRPLVIWAIGLAIYGIFTYKFYRYLAQRRVLSLNLNQYNSAQHPAARIFFATVAWIIEFAIGFPIIVFFWFAVLTLILGFLSTNTLQTTALISMALVTAVRVTSYFSEDLSRDMAKMMPFAILGVFLVDARAINVSEEIANISAWMSMLDTLIYYILFIVALELILRLGNAFRTQKKEE